MRISKRKESIFGYDGTSIRLYFTFDRHRLIETKRTLIVFIRECNWNSVKNESEEYAWNLAG